MRTRLRGRWWTWRGPALAVLALALAGPSGTAGGGPPAGDPAARVLAAAAAYAPALESDAAALRRACGVDSLCAARRLAARLGPGARLERVVPPDTDTIRWARSVPSLGPVRRLTDGRLLVGLERFGRTVDSGLAAALAEGAAGRGLVLDLRANRGGDFGRMLRVAARLIGPRAGVIVLHGPHGPRPLDLPRLDALAAGPITVVVGPRTASSAEVLAALLRRHGGAELVGARSAGKDRVSRLVPVDHAWRLVLPGERIEVPGERLAGGLAPDRPLPAALAARGAP